MSEKERVTEGQRWLRHAKEDLDAATHWVANGTSCPRHVCSYAQQVAEAALKAALLLAGQDFPHTHDLDVLADLLPSAWPVRHARIDLASLTQWEVRGRYPGDWEEATQADAVEAMDHAKQVHDLVWAEFDRRLGEAEPREAHQS